MKLPEGGSAADIAELLCCVIVLAIAIAVVLR